MTTSSRSLQYLTQASLIAALYAVLTLLLPVASFGTMQCRLSEALSVLPVCSAAAVPGLTLGCAIANAIGAAMGANITGFWDVLIGSAATLCAALCTRALRRVRVRQLPIFSVLPPVFINAAVIGAQLCMALLGDFTMSGWLLMAAQVAAGQLIPCIMGGLFVVHTVEKNRVFLR